MASDGAGGVWIGREFGGSSSGDSLEILRFGIDGTPPRGWNSLGRVITTNRQLGFVGQNLLATSDGGAFVLGSSGYYLRRLRPDGSDALDSTGVSIQVSGGPYGGPDGPPAALALAGNAMCILYDYANGKYDHDAVLSATDSSGFSMWNNGVPIPLSVPSTEGATGVISYPAELQLRPGGGVIASWIDATNPVGLFGFVARVQAVDSNGVVLWPLGGIHPYRGSGDDRETRMVGDGQGGVFVGVVRATDRFADPHELRVGHIRADGSRDPAWPDTGLTINDSGADPMWITGMLSERDGGFLLAWYTSYAAGEHLARISPSGTVLWQVVVDPGSGYGLISDGRDGAWWVSEKLVAGVFGQPTDTDLYIGHVGASGAPLINNKLVATGPQVQQFVGACSDDGGGIILVWNDFRLDPSGRRSQVYGQNVNADGSLGGTVVAALASLISSDVAGLSVALKWDSPSRHQSYDIERRAIGDDWVTIASAIWPDGQGVVAFADEVPAAGTYDYRLAWRHAGQRVDGSVATVRVTFGGALTLSAPTDVAGRRVGLRYRVPEGDRIRLELFDLSGRRIRVFREASSEQGDHTLWWDGRDDSGVRVARGLYLARLTDGNAHLEAKLVTLGE
jgi:hypothetical protein